jgi:DNA ligase D-like protein (predicted 3'-phosphoesterase)
MAGKDALKPYRRKRDFRKTAEPKGRPPRRAARPPIFVVQKHRARTLHYDFRLEVDGVLKSWAVPKGPSVNPGDKRLAVLVEDHPLDYADFEGVIPEGEYGAGAVIVWDRGTYGNLKEEAGEGAPVSMADAIEAGEVAVRLEGQKLRGGFALVRTRMGGNPKNWLLIKMKDTDADPRRNPVENEPASVLTGRTIEKILEEEGKR